MPHKICVLGGGSWGATIASHLARNGHAVSLWEFVINQAEWMKRTRTLEFLPQLKIPESVQITSAMQEALSDAEIIFSVVPSEHVRGTWRKAAPANPQARAVVSLSKGIEPDSLKRMSEVIEEEFPPVKGRVVAVSGPSHAEEVAAQIPTAVVAASPDQELAALAQNLLVSPVFRVYTSPDIVGVEIGGSVKNIFAIACGICDGLGLGDNTKAALVTRGLGEIAKLGVAMGARQVTFFGLAGMGDLIVTSFSKHSRNRLLGEKIGRGKSADDALKEMTMVAEGYPTSKSAYQLAAQRNIDCPIIAEIYRVLYEGKDVRQSMTDLMERPQRGEAEELIWS